MANSYKRYYKFFSVAATDNILTVPAATTAIIKSIIVANHNTVAVDISVDYAPLGTGNVTIVPLQSLARDTYLDLLAGKVAGPLILEAADILKIESTAGNVSVTVSALLVDRN